MQTFSKGVLKTLWVTGGALILTMVTVPLVQANDGGTLSGDHTTQSTDKSISTEVRPPRVESRVEPRRAESDKLRVATEAAKNKSEVKTAKKLSCQKHEEFVAKRMDHLTSRSTKQLELFNAVTGRIESYATNKNLTVPNYNALLSDIAVKKVVAQSNLSDLQAAKAAFACDVANPKAAATAYQTALKNTNKALKDYRESIKKLLLAVKTTKTTANATKAETSTTEKK